MSWSCHINSTSIRHCLAALLVAPVLLIPARGLAQTWSGGRSTPPLSELVTVDATGEPGWPFGVEDVAGDGATFDTAEQSVDVRSVYAVTDGTRLWWRAYVSSAGSPDESLRLYLFVDSDRDSTTGGSAAVSAIEPAFVADPTDGGYEHVFGLTGQGTVIDVWDHRAAQDDFVTNSDAAQRAEAEAGTDTDPLLFRGDVHGYVSGSVELGAVELAQVCDADLFVRAVSDQGDDLNVGTRVRCIPPDDNDDGVPDVVENVADCDEDADCPAGGRCISGECRYAPACTTDGDCDAGETCSDGRCVATGGDSCEASDECGGLVCEEGTCTPCGDGGAACASGQACGPDGRCVAGNPGAAEGSAALVDPDETVRGGAFTCGIAGRRHDDGRWILIAALALGLRRRRAL
jgi:hypothetical protein